MPGSVLHFSQIFVGASGRYGQDAAVFGDSVMRTIFSTAASVLALLMAGGAASAADLITVDPIYLSPTLPAELSAPSFFTGLYAGALVGPVSNRMDNFFTAGEDLRAMGTLFAGYGVAIAPGIIVSGEVQGSINSDFKVATNYDAFALARLGFLTSDEFMTYLTAGAGWFATSWAFAFGGGFEWRVLDNVALRAEGLGIGQLGPVPNGNNKYGISAMRITAGASFYLDGTAPWSPGIVETTDFDGAYAGLYVGGIFNPPWNFFVDHGNGLHLSRFTYGGMAGYNFRAGAFVLGAEVQGGVSFDTSGDVGVDGAALARFGLVPFEGAMVYVAGGAALLESKPAYALGGGVEYALWGDASLRAEWLSYGELSATPTVSGFTAHKATVGTVWHFN